MAKFFINRPIFAIVVSIIIVLLGIVSAAGLSVAQYPIFPLLQFLSALNTKVLMPRLLMTP